MCPRSWLMTLVLALSIVPLLPRARGAIQPVRNREWHLLALAQTTSPLIGPDAAPFTDGVLDIQLKRSDAAGAVVLVMENGRAAISRGYGWADVKRRRAVVPETTLFRVGEISQIVTAIAVMQLVEQDKLSLDRDVDDYLDFRLPPSFAAPITLRDLLTHSSGLIAKNPVERQSQSSLPLRQYLLADRPARFYPPGAVHAYCSYGIALAGYIVQRVSGQPFAQYTEEHIFRPLRMDHSTFAQPLSAALAGDLSNGYLISAEPPLSFEELNAAPADGMFATAADMGRLGRALLNGGELDGARVLQSSSVAQIMARQAAASAALPAMGLGLYQIWFNGLHFCGQTGDTTAFHSVFQIEPERKMIVFVSYNSRGKGEHLVRFARGELIHGILDRYVPYHPKVSPIASAAEDGEAIVGTWQATTVGRRSLSWFSGQLHASVDRADRSLLIDRFVSDRGQVKHWQEIAPDLWQQYPQDRIFAVRNAKGTVVRLVLAATPDVELVRVPWFENARLLSAFGVLLFFLFVTGVVALYLYKAQSRDI